MLDNKTKAENQPVELGTFSLVIFVDDKTRLTSRTLRPYETFDSKISLYKRITICDKRELPHRLAISTLSIRRARLSPKTPHMNDSFSDQQLYA
jgi:hypothetical protein